MDPGKGPCNSCAGCVKQMVSSAVKRREVIVNSPMSFYKYAKTKFKKTNLDICNKNHFGRHTIITKIVI